MFTGCSEGYNIRICVRQLNSIDTHMAELRSSGVRRLNAMLSYLNQENFMSHLKFICGLETLWWRASGQMTKTILKFYANFIISGYLLSLWEMEQRYCVFTFVISWYIHNVFSHNFAVSYYYYHYYDEQNWRAFPKHWQGAPYQFLTLWTRFAVKIA